MVQWLGLHTPNAGDLGLIPGWGTRSHMLQLSNQINKIRNTKKQNLKIELPYDLAIPLLGIYLEKTLIQKNTCTLVFIAALFTVAKTSSVQSYPTLCDPMNHSMPGLPVHHQLLESTQTHVHWVGDSIQPSHPLSSPSPSAFNLSQHQGLFK